ncbi:SH3 domain-containing protein [Flavobacterium chungangense]|uniref:Ligand-binding protein SH3 n=1 Tax=Flavobacterium chungangense TaxID=554283 RepID=A0A6V6ZAT0_9FLAO|nr:SH3 domain-containing protein [Flavobacterium chungangense]CAD0008860.1 ligand-binding protein SH3 [Flavobacterium chungangense]
MKKYYFIAVLFCSALLYSQDRYFINSDTRLYTSADTSSEFLGYFKYSAQVRLLSDNQNGWYKVLADNFNEGYVRSEFISKSLNARDVKTVDNENPIIYGGDHYHGSNHLFVLVAGLKVRALPDKNSKIREVLFTGDAVTIGYFPKNEEEWVNISGSINEEYAKFTLRKFVGKRPDLNVLIKNFEKLDVNNITERKTVSERIVELAWNSDYSKLPSAYEKYYEVVKQLNDPKLLADTELNIALAKGLAKHKSPEQIIAFSKKAEFVLKGTKTKSLYLSQKDLVSTFGKPNKKASISDDCGIYLSDLFYYYPDLEVSVDEKNNKAEIVKVFINENNKLIISPNHILDRSVSEKAFIEKYGTYIDASIKSPHHYSIITEYSQFGIEFRNGKLFAIEIFFYC